MAVTASHGIASRRIDIAIDTDTDMALPSTGI